MLSSIFSYSYTSYSKDFKSSLIVSSTNDWLLLIVIDVPPLKSIPRFNPLNKQDPDITLSAEDRKIGGLGIFITKKTMDDVIYTYEKDENILTMNKKI